MFRTVYVTVAFRKVYLTVAFRKVYLTVVFRTVYLIVAFRTVYLTVALNSSERCTVRRCYCLVYIIVSIGGVDSRLQ